MHRDDAEIQREVSVSSEGEPVEHNATTEVTDASES
jgi:hypothetical protein